MIPPCSYQGGKQRLAKQIVDIIFENESIDSETQFFNLCCGSGAFSIELMNRGIHPNNITMIDKGCFGSFWQSIANEEFDINVFKKKIEDLPEIHEIQSYLKILSQKPVNEQNMIYDYLLLQCGAFGSKQIWVENGMWKNCSFRSFWKPTKTSNRKSVVNPMMPMPKTLYKRVEEIVDECSGRITAMCDYAENANFLIDDLKNNNAIVYIDPPYKDTTKYGFKFDSYEFVLQCWKAIPIYVSEGYQMSQRCWLLDSGRKKGNITGNSRKQPVIEYLSLFK